MSDVPLPQIHDRAWIAFDPRLQDTHPSRVESFIDHEYKLAAPFRQSKLENDKEETQRPELIELLKLPTSAIIAWRCETGFAWSHCEVIEVIEADLVLWKMEIAREAQVVQRRFFPRIPDNSQARLQIGDISVGAHLIDLGEGGLQCIIPSAHLDESDPRLIVELILDDGTFQVEGTILRSSLTEDGDINLAIQFGRLSENQVIQIRRHVFGKQMAIAQIKDL